MNKLGTQNLFSEPAWADSSDFPGVYIMWQPKDDLGVILAQVEGDAEPTLIFCSLFDDPEKVFLNGRNVPKAGMKLSELRDAMAKLEEVWNNRQPWPFPRVDE